VQAAGDDAVAVLAIDVDHAAERPADRPVEEDRRPAQPVGRQANGHDRLRCASLPLQPDQLALLDQVLPQPALRRDGLGYQAGDVEHADAGVGEELLVVGLLHRPVTLAVWLRRLEGPSTRGHPPANIR
jgi:hypothetical protein